MKRRIVTSMMVIIVGITSAFANNREGISEKILSNFQKEFHNAKEVSWQAGEQFMKVSFTLDDQVFTAYYNEAGERLAIARNLRSSELPMGLREELRNSYGNYWISDLFEIHGKEEAAYYVTIENADFKITLKSVGMSDWIGFKKTEKK